MTAPAPDPSTAASRGWLRDRIRRVASASALALVVGEGVSLVQTIALARLLSPAEVGVFAAGTVLVLFLGTFVEGGLRAALVQRSEDGLPVAAETVFRVTAATGLLLGLGALASAPVLGLLLGSREVGLVAAASSGVVLLFSFTNVPEAMLQRGFSVRRRIVVGPSVAVAFAGVSVTLAALGWGVWSMVAGLYASYVVWVVLVWVLTDWRPGRVRGSVALWREMARYGAPLVAGAVAMRVHQLVETVLVGRLLGAASLGQFRYAQRIAQIPVAAVVEVGAVALFPAFSRMADDAVRLRAAFLRSLRLATTGAAALSGLMIALGVPAVTVVLGDAWRTAGFVVVAMAGLGLGRTVVSVCEEVVKGRGRTTRLGWYFALDLVLGLGLLVVLVPWFGLVGVGLSISATALATAAVCLALARGPVGCSWRSVLAAVLPPLPAAAVATAVTWALENTVLHADDRHVLIGLLCLALDGIVFAVVYLSSLAVTMPRDARAVVTAVGRRR